MTYRKGVPAPLGATPHRTMDAQPRGEVPLAKRPARPRDVHGNELMDLFLFFPDLPRPARPRAGPPMHRRLRRVRV